MWRILSYDIHNRNPTVISLAFHLEDQHSVMFDEQDLLDNVLHDPSINASMFLEWMKCNQRYEEARQLTYLDFPTRFVWNKDTKLWTLRKKFTGSIVRIHHVSPQTGELFYMRILLNKVKGPTSYEDIKTVEGNICSTFKETCYEMGLLDDDQEYINAIKESFCHILPNNNLAGLVRRAKLIIWDEAPMVKKICVETLDRTFRDIFRSTNPNSMETPFGGKVIVFGGDFRQILPVITKGKRENIVAATLNSSYIWDHVTVQRLTVNMRLSVGPSIESDQDNRKNVEEILNFADWLLKIGNGDVNLTEYGISEIEMLDDVLVNDVEDPIGSIISSVYPDYLNNLGNPTYYQ
ncbi:uncharacterized protein [Rutidosis leptorrhynchoides]|uniref:uncharacterized protein n=1 Tax=Rutidosis leptorrhynchoides TaxID=125765 RepID=UPI003A99BFAD